MTSDILLGTRMRQWGGFLRYAATRYRKDGASRMAAALSYTSLLSLVPLMAIALAMLAAFPVFDGVRETLVGWAFENFVPAIGEVVQSQVNKFVANAGRLTAAGIIGLAFTAIMLLVTIEGSFNSVFRVARERSIMSKVLVYWTVLTLGPLLMGASLSLQGYLTALGKLAITKTATPYLAAPLPTLLSIIAFTVLYATVPNRRIRLKDAILGGVLAGLLFGALRWGFGVYITSSKAYTSLYGAVAAVPIFLFWMFLSWAVVLIGAEITAALPEWRAGYHVAERRSAGARWLTLALEVLSILRRSARNGGKGASRRDLLFTTAVPERELMTVLRRLYDAGFAAPTSGERTLLARDLDTVTLRDLIAALELEPGLDDAVATTSEWRAKAETLIGEARKAVAAALDVPLAEVLSVTDEA